MTTKDRKAFGGKVRAARLAKGLTQRQAAEKCDVTQPAYCNVENGVASAGPNLLKAIKKALKVEP